MSTLKNIDETKKQELALCIENLTVKYGETLAIAGVCLNVEVDEYIAIIGPNGGGKTTLLKTILGLVTPTCGSIDIFGKKPGKTGQLLGYVPQISTLDKSFPITVHEVVLTGRLNPKLSLFHKYTQSDMGKADELLERVGIYRLKDRMISDLSGGEFQKMLIARALAVNPKLLLLDEPTASVDASARDQIFSLLNELNNSMTIILVTHDLLAVSSHVKSLACLNRELVYHGGTELNEDVVKTLYGCPIDLIAHGVPHRVLKDHEESE
jgi:zinc transport system ATP-binding protein